MSNIDHILVQRVMEAFGYTKAIFTYDSFMGNVIKVTWPEHKSPYTHILKPLCNGLLTAPAYYDIEFHEYLNDCTHNEILVFSNGNGEYTHKFV